MQLSCLSKPQKHQAKCERPTQLRGDDINILLQAILGFPCRGCALFCFKRKGTSFLNPIRSSLEHGAVVILISRFRPGTAGVSTAGRSCRLAEEQPGGGRMLHVRPKPGEWNLYPGLSRRESLPIHTRTGRTASNNLLTMEGTDACECSSPLFTIVGFRKSQDRKEKVKTWRRDGARAR